MASKKEVVTTPEFRAAFVNLFKPSAGLAGGKPKYRLVMLFDAAAQKTAEFGEMRRIAKAAAEDKWGADKTKWPKGLDTPFKNGDEKPEYMGYPGNVYASAARDAEKMGKPGVVDAARNIITDEAAVYSGCYMRARVLAYAYTYAGKNGVRFGLQHVQKIRDGEAFAGGGRPEEAFDATYDGEAVAATPVADSDGF